jgi:hypothetical protein
VVPDQRLPVWDLAAAELAARGAEGEALEGEEGGEEEEEEGAGA